MIVERIYLYIRQWQRIKAENKRNFVALFFLIRIVRVFFFKSANSTGNTDWCESLADGVSLLARVCQACEYLHARRDQRCMSWWRCPTRVGTSHAYANCAFAYMYVAHGWIPFVERIVGGDRTRKHALCRDIIGLHVLHVNAWIRWNCWTPATAAWVWKERFCWSI